jgi:heme-degrading monooxygenase HmoA
MHARVTSVSGSPSAAEAGIENFRANVVPFAREHGTGAILLLDRETGEGLAITLWSDEQALRASEERASALRAEAANQMGATEDPEVRRYEVAVFEV